MKAIKHQIGPRVDTPTLEALERLAAARGTSLATYAAQALAEHVRRHQGDGIQDFLDEMLHQFEERLATVSDRLRREFEDAVKRLQKQLTRNIDVIKATVDASVETREQPHIEEYRQRVAKILREWTIQANGARQ
jgi:DNA anti-recombination protein RmuC